MEKRRKWILILVVVEIAICFFIMAMMFVPAMRHKYSEYTFSGLDVVFGAKYRDSNLVAFNFSFLNLLPYMIILLAEVLIASKILLEKTTTVNIVIAVLFLIAGVFFTLTKTFTQYGEEIKGFVSAVDINIAETFTLSFGPIASGIASISLALLVSCETIAFRR